MLFNNNHNFRFFKFLAAILIFGGKQKIVNISKTVRVRAISIEFLTHRAYGHAFKYMSKFFIFSIFGGHLGFLRKIKNHKYLVNPKR